MEDTKDLEAAVIDIIRRDGVNVPPYPAVAMQLQRLASSEDYSVKDVQRIVSGDPVLAATVLRYANSAAFRGINPTSTLEAAIGRIGANEVCKIALATSIGAHAIVTGSLSALRRRYWRMAMTSALLCRSLATFRKQNSEEAFICGLLHDFGQIVATACFEEILSRGKDTRLLPESSWEALVDHFHVELGLITAARWNLPNLIISIISAHNNPKSAPAQKDLLELILAGDAVAQHLDHEAFPTVASLEKLPQLLPNEATKLAPILPSIAAALASLDETTPGRNTGVFHIPPRIQPATTTLLGPPKAIAHPLQVLKSSGNVPYQAIRIARDGLAFKGEGKLRENSMVRVRLEIPAAPLEAWVVVTHCTMEGRIVEMEAKFFAADAAFLKTWTGYYDSIP